MADILQIKKQTLKVRTEIKTVDQQSEQKGRVVAEAAEAKTEKRLLFYGYFCSSVLLCFFALSCYAKQPTIVLGRSVTKLLPQVR